MFHPTDTNVSGEHLHGKLWVRPTIFSVMVHVSRYMVLIMIIYVHILWNLVGSCLGNEFMHLSCRTITLLAAGL